MKGAQVGLLAGAALIALTSNAYAQSEQDGARTGGSVLDEVIVTAEKRAQNLQDVPATVTAVTAELAQQRGIVNMTDLAMIVPGLTMTKSNSSNFVFLRGVGQAQGNNGIESPIALYIDGVYMFSPIGAVMSLNDLQQIEVLKGPQGTLFGRNATGGVIQVFTKDPSEEPALEADIGYATYNTVEGHFYGARGLGGGLAGSIALYGKNQGEGFGQNTYTGNELYFTKSFAAHTKLVWTSEEQDLKLTLNGFADYANTTPGAGGVFPGYKAVDGVTTYIDRHDVSLRVDPENESQQEILSAKIEKEWDWGKIVNLAAYHNLRHKGYIIQNGIPGVRVNPITRATPPAQYFSASFHNVTWTNEFQIQAPADQDFQWVGGIFLLRDTSDTSQLAARNETVVNLISSSIETQSVAGFAQFTKTVLPETRLTLGIRATRDEISMTGVNSVAPISPAAAGLPPSITHSKVTYRAAIDHDFTDQILGYVSFNTGFKAGRYTNTNFANPPLDPETIKAWEAGLKTELFDRRLRLNTSIFSYEYNNLQLRAGNNAGVSLSVNAGSAEGRGVDVDFEAAPTDNLRLSGGFEYFEGEYSSFVRAPCSSYNRTTSAISTFFCDLSGAPMVRAPTWSGTFGATYTWPTEIGEFSLNATATYSGRYNFEPDGVLVQEPYTTLSALASWRSPSERWAVELWGTNLTDSDHFASVVTGQTYQYFPSDPRQVGVRLKYKM